MSESMQDKIERIIAETKKTMEERQMSENVGVTLDELIELRKKTEAQYDALPVYDKAPVMSGNGENHYLDCPACKSRARHSFRYFNRFSGSQPQEVGIEKPSIRTECQVCGYEANFRIELEEAVVPVAPHVRRKRRTREEIEAEKADPVTVPDLEDTRERTAPKLGFPEPKE